MFMLDMSWKSRFRYLSYCCSVHKYIWSRSIKCVVKNNFVDMLEYSYETDEYKCYSKHFSDEIVENDFAYFIVENYEQSCRNVKEVLKRRE